MNRTAVSDNKSSLADAPGFFGFVKFFLYYNVRTLGQSVRIVSQCIGERDRQGGWGKVFKAIVAALGSERVIVLSCLAGLAIILLMLFLGTGEPSWADVERELQEMELEFR